MGGVSLPLCFCLFLVGWFDWVLVGIVVDLC